MDDGLGERIKHARISLGLSQTALASAVGISNSYLSHIEAGRRPVKEAVLQQLNAVLGAELEPNDGSESLDSLQFAMARAQIALRNGERGAARQLLDQLVVDPSGPDGDQLADQVAWARARTLEAEGDLDQALLLYEQLLSNAGATVPRHEVHAAIVRVVGISGEVAKAIQVGEAAMSTCPPEDEDAVGRAQLAAAVAACYLQQGDLRHATSLMRDALEPARESAARAVRAHAVWQAAVDAEQASDRAQARHLADVALILYAELDERRVIGLLHVAYANLLLEGEKPQILEAKQVLTRARHELEGVGTTVDQAHVRAAWARAELLAGEVAAAASAAERALDALPARERLQRSRTLLLLGHVHRAQGLTDQALREFRLAGTTLTEAGIEQRAASTWRDLGEAFASIARFEDAVEAMRRANDLARIHHNPLKAGRPNAMSM